MTQLFSGCVCDPLSSWTDIKQYLHKLLQPLTDSFNDTGHKALAEKGHQHQHFWFPVFTQVFSDDHILKETKIPRAKSLYFTSLLKYPLSYVRQLYLCIHFLHVSWFPTHCLQWDVLHRIVPCCNILYSFWRHFEFTFPPPTVIFT